MIQFLLKSGKNNNKLETENRSVTARYLGEGSKKEFWGDDDVPILCVSWMAADAHIYVLVKIHK